jgi:hypothetical protein
MTTEITTCDTGLGTTYERWALNRLLSRIQSQHDIRSVLEGPGDGMTGIAGINSLILARGGAQVTVVLPDQARADLARRVYATYGCQDNVTFQVSPVLKLSTPHPPFDLVWNFNVMPRLQTPGVALKEMIQASGRFVLVFVPNRANYSFWLHRLHHRVTHEAWDHGPPALLKTKPWQRLLQEQGLAVRETLLVDVPWWPDIVDLGRLIQDFFPPLSRWASKNQPENRYTWQADDLPYFDPARYAEVHRRLERLSFIERSRWRWLKTRFAHHVGVLAEKKDV